MAIRRQTVALLVALGGVVVFAALYHRPRVSEREPVFYTPTPAQVSATFARLRTPKGFSPTRRICSGNELCFHRSPSVKLSPARMDQWLREADLAPVRRSGAPGAECATTHVRHTHFVIMHCGQFLANEGKVTIDAYATSVLLEEAHGPRATTVRLGSASTGYEGTELHLLDFGVPSPETIRAEQAEAKERG